MQKVLALLAVGFAFVSQPAAADDKAAAAPAANATAPAKANAAKPAEAAKATDAPKGPEAGKAAAAPASPTLPAEGKKLVDGFVGNWSSKDTTMTMGGNAIKGKMSMKCEKAAKGWGTVCKAKFDMGKNMPKDESVFVYAWDMAAGEGHMLEVASSGEVHDHVGKWADDKSITLVRTGKNLDGKEEVDSVTFTWVSPKEIAMKGEGTVAGAVAWSMTSTAKK